MLANQHSLVVSDSKAKALRDALVVSISNARTLWDALLELSK